jgi:hypothetical protein
VVVGARRTAEELGRAFPGTPVVTSAGDVIVSQVPARPALVVATPGAEPCAVDGYGAALLLDTWALLGRQDLRAAEDALWRWMNAAALVRSRGAGGVVTVVAESALPTVQSLIRWDPVGHADAELAARAEVGLPPAVHIAALDGKTVCGWPPRCVVRSGCSVPGKPMSRFGSRSTRCTSGDLDQRFRAVKIKYSQRITPPLRYSAQSSASSASSAATQAGSPAICR